MEPEPESLACKDPGSGLYIAALIATSVVAFTCLCRGIQLHSSVSFGVAYLAVLPVIALAVRRGGAYLFVLAAFAAFTGMLLQAFAFDWDAMSNLRPVTTSLLISALVACILQIALTLQLFNRRRAEHNPWARSLSWGVTMGLVMFVAFTVTHRPDSPREWSFVARESVCIGGYWLVYIRYLAPTRIRTWDENKKEMLLVSHWLTGRPRQPPR